MDFCFDLAKFLFLVWILLILSAIREEATPLNKMKQYPSDFVGFQPLIERHFAQVIQRKLGKTFALICGLPFLSELLIEFVKN